MANSKTLVLGIGSPILCDDAVGLRVARRIKEARANLEVGELNETGVGLLEVVPGWEKVIIVDSIKTGRGEPGELYELEMEDLRPSSELSSSHGIGIATAFALGERLGYAMPREISIYAVEIADNTTFSEECTAAIETRIPSIAKQIIKREKL